MEPQTAFASFAIHGRITSCGRYGNGHINDTWLVVSDQAGTTVRHILQRLNRRVFPDPGLVMANIAAVLGHLAETAPDADPRSRLALLPTRAGRPWLVDGEGDHWRCYPFIEGTRTVEQVTRPAEAEAAARAFAGFQRQLASYHGPALTETIADFHHTPRRLERLRDAAVADRLGRAAEVGPELAWALDQRELAQCIIAALAAGTVPLRITHNDTKINNVLFAADRDEGVCVIDLDTLMPGSALYDFGDLVRTATATTAEDATDLAAVDSDPAAYAALIDGWLAGAGEALSHAERELLPLAGAVMTFEVGVRFLTDHLEGDRYFRIRRPGHNRDRARNQLAMARAILHRHCLACATPR